MNGTAIILAEDLVTALTGAFNAGYFARYWLRSAERRARRTGALALVLLGAAAITEAAFSQGALRLHEPLAAPSDGVWALARLPLLLATAFITTIVIRRIKPR